MVGGFLGDVFAGLTSANLKRALDQGIPEDVLARAITSPEMRAALKAAVAEKERNSQKTKSAESSLK